MRSPKGLLLTSVRCFFTQRITFLIYLEAILSYPEQFLLQAESLAKKYEEKYKQVAEIGSKLTIEEARFREIEV